VGEFTATYASLMKRVVGLEIRAQTKREKNKEIESIMKRC
jgi:hypothetical protein